MSATGGAGIPGPPRAGIATGGRGDPFSYRSAAEADFAARAAAGNAQALFAKSPGGVVATAARVAGWRGAIDRACAGTPISPTLLEGLVFVESAGRPEVIAGSDAADAAGLTQILAATGSSFLGMRIDLPASRRLTERIDALETGGGSARRLRSLLARRASVDARFDPAEALAATVRYLQSAERQFGREDLAFESYHMGIGNLTQALDDYDGGRVVPYAQLYFDSTPTRHRAAYALLSGLGDDSELYLWRVEEAVHLMHLYRTDRPALVRLARLETADGAGAAVLHPHVRPYRTPAALSAAYRRRQLVPLPSNLRSLGLVSAPGMGAGARQLGAPPGLYRGLRPVALRLLIDLAAQVRRLSGLPAPLTIATTVSDERYQQAEDLLDPPAATGYSFTIARSYAGGAEAQAFQEVLDRLQSLNLIAWGREPAVIEITVASDAAAWLARA